MGAVTLPHSGTVWREVKAGAVDAWESEHQHAPVVPALERLIRQGQG